MTEQDGPFLTSTLFTHHSQLTLDEVQLWIEQSGFKKVGFNTKQVLKTNLLPDGSSLKIKQVRELQTELAMRSFSDKPRHVLLWQAHLLTASAQNALLKTLEEPPHNTWITLATPYPNQLLETIRSRCRQAEIPLHPTQEDTSELIELAVLEKKAYSELIELAATYKDRDQAQALIEKLLRVEHGQLADSSHPDRLLKRSSQLKTLQETLTRLKANTNVRLTLENCFFAIKYS